LLGARGMAGKRSRRTGIPATPAGLGLTAYKKL
jgi:hypothetical protein